MQVGLNASCLLQIVVEAAVALLFAIVGATVRSPPLREVTWRSEMKRRYVDVLRHDSMIPSDHTQSCGRRRGPSDVFCKVRATSRYRAQSADLVMTFWHCICSILVVPLDVSCYSMLLHCILGTEPASINFPPHSHASWGVVAYAGAILSRLSGMSLLSSGSSR